MSIKYYEDSHITIYQGDCRNMAELPDESVQMVVTSPPYWGLRKYSGEQDLVWGGEKSCQHQWVSEKQYHGNPVYLGKTRWQHDKGGSPAETPGIYEGEGKTSERYLSQIFCALCGAVKCQLGLEPTVEMYVEHLVEICREIRRVLRKDGVFFLNIGDSYAGSGGANENKRRGGVVENPNRKPQSAVLKPKDLCLIPFRLAIALQEDGWWVRSVIIYSKANPMPESATNRPTESHEYILMLTKSGTTQYWTHRDGLGGTRKKPKPDYRWVKRAHAHRQAPGVAQLDVPGSPMYRGGHHQDGLPYRGRPFSGEIIEEVATEPSNWKEKVDCPDCGATGKVKAGPGFDYEQECPTCLGKRKIQLWRRINLWRGHDYFWDQEAVREPYTEPLNRWGGPEVRTPSHKYIESGEHNGRQGYGAASLFRYGRPIRPIETGRNIRSVWTINTQPFPGAHFAVFPEELVARCIKAATPEIGCCSKCGAPWERITQLANELGLSESSSFRTGLLPQYETLGWQPSCSCRGYRIRKDLTPEERAFVEREMANV